VSKKLPAFADERVEIGLRPKRFGHQPRGRLGLHQVCATYWESDGMFSGRDGKPWKTTFAPASRSADASAKPMPSRSRSRARRISQGECFHL